MDSLFVYLIWFSVVGILSIFFGVENAGKIFLGFVFLFSFIRGFFSIKENIQDIKEAINGYNPPQDLVFNGIRIPLNVAIISTLKIIFWCVFYYFTFWFATLYFNESLKDNKRNNQNRSKILPYESFLSSINYSNAKLLDTTIYRAGKILPVNELTKSIDSLFYVLPNNLIPKDTTEIKMLLLITKNHFAAKKLQDGSFVRIKILKCRLIDINRNISFSDITVRGGLPSDIKYNSLEDEYGDPTLKLINYLENLPLKDSIP